MNTKLNNHEQILRNEIFFTKNKWPHFDLLFEDLKKISKNSSKNKTIISLERNRLYGGISLFAPFFFKQKFISIDCYTKKLFKRGAYNKHLINNKIKKTHECYYKNIKVKKNSGDIIIIPNLLHHIENVDSLFFQSKKILKKKGSIYIFEPLLRELHQEPEDYGRFTPYGLKSKLKKFGFKKFKINFCGGPFTAAAYCWDQACQYLPKKLRKKEINWHNRKLKYFQILDKKFKKNLLRKYTTFPVSFSILAQK